MDHPLRKYDDAKLVFYFANRMQSQAEFDDLVSEGMIGLLNAKRTFDPSRGAWHTHAGQCILKQMWEFSRRNKSLVGGFNKINGTTQKNEAMRSRAEAAAMRCASIDEPVLDDKTIGDMLASDDESPEDMAARIEDVRRVREAMAVLDDRERCFVSELFGSERSNRDVGNDHGLCRSRVQQIADRAMNKLALQLVRKEAA